MIKYCDWVELANKVMENYNIDHRWPPKYVCQEMGDGGPDCKNCIIYRVAKHDLGAISLFLYK